MVKMRANLQALVGQAIAVCGLVSKSVGLLSRDMTSVITIASSALAAQSVNLNTIADNIANATTPGYQAKQAVFTPMNPGVSVSAVVDTGQTVDLATQLVSMKLAQTAYAAAAKVMGTANQMTDALLAAI
jgi:flagellar hook protein FlgE